MTIAVQKLALTYIRRTYRRPKSMFWNKLASNLWLLGLLPRANMV